MCNWYLVLLCFALLSAFVCDGGAEELSPENNGTLAPTSHGTTVTSDILNAADNSSLDLPATSSNITQENTTDPHNSTLLPTSPGSTTPAGNITATPESVTEESSTVPTEKNTTSNSTQESSAGTTPTPTSANDTQATTVNETSSAAPTKPTSESTESEGPSTAGSSKKPSDFTVRISETNMLSGADQGDAVFIELKGEAREDLSGLWLIVHDAEPGATTPHFKINLDSVALDDNGFYLLNNDNGLTLSKDLSLSEALFIGLYLGEPGPGLEVTGVLDVLLYSSHGSLDQSLQEKFVGVTKFPLTLDLSQLSGVNSKEVSLSRCTQAVSNEAFVLATATSGVDNQCTLDSNKQMEMLLTLKKPPCPDQLPSEFNDDLIAKIISGMNSAGQCGVARKNIDGVQVIKSCIGEHMTQVDVHFTLRANLDPHLALVEEGYKSFVSAPSNRVVQVAESDFLLHNCTHLCRPPMVNPHNSDSGNDNKTQVTVGVVLTCVGVFIVVLLAVVFYMKRKRRGILQFRMTRLDEDDDDVVGDMDDFVGNQGPTFRNFR